MLPRDEKAVPRRSCCGFTRATTGPKMHFIAARSLHESATHHGCGEFAGHAIVELTQLSDRHEFEGGKPEGAVTYECFESPNRHLVQASSDFPESSCAIGLECRPPRDERALAENQVCPWKNRKEMPTQRVVPRGTEADQDFTVIPQERSKDAQCSGGVRKVLEGIHRHDYVGEFVS